MFLEQLETEPAHYLPEVTDDHLDDDVVHIDLTRPMAEIRAAARVLPIKTRVSLTGPMVVARDLAHARIKAMLERGEQMPPYLRDHCVYYAGPAKTPEGYASGSFGPTTAGRMDSYVDLFQKAGGSFVMLAKGNRSAAVTNACQDNGGFYLGSIGGPAARLAQDNIRKVEVLDFPELGMEAVWRIEVEDFPAFVVVDDKGNDFFAETLSRCRRRSRSAHRSSPSQTGRAALRRQVVVQVDGARGEAVDSSQPQPRVRLRREGPGAGAHEDRHEQQVDLVDQAGPDHLARELGSADAHVAIG